MFSSGSAECVSKDSKTVSASPVVAPQRRPHHIRMRLRLRTDKLAELLAASRLSQNHWAIKLGLSRGHWSDIVNGRHPYPSRKRASE